VIGKKLNLPHRQFFGHAISISPSADGGIGPVHIFFHGWTFASVVGKQPILMDLKKSSAGPC